MTRYAAAAIPWSRVLPAAVLATVLMEMVQRWPFSTWALQGGAVGVIAAGTAWTMDEPAAGVVDTSPRSLAWRTCARLPALGLLAAGWTVAVGRSWDSLGGHGTTVLLQGLAAMALAAGWTTWRRAGGVAVPGTAVAIAVIPAALMWGLTRLSEWVPVLPYVAASADDWTASSRGWWAAGAVGLLTVAAALGDVRWWRRPGSATFVDGEHSPRGGSAWHGP